LNKKKGAGLENWIQIFLNWNLWCIVLEVFFKASSLVSPQSIFGSDPSRERIKFSHHYSSAKGDGPIIVIHHRLRSTIVSFFLSLPILFVGNSERYYFITILDMGRWTQYDEVRLFSFAIWPEHPTSLGLRMITACQRA